MARTRAADFGDKKRAILGAAARVFATQGMERASMAGIAAEAQVSKALLYHYYPSRDALVFDIVHTHLSDLEAAIETADRPEAAPEARLGALILTVLEVYRDADDRHQVQLAGLGSLSEDQRAAIREVERRIVRRFAAVIRAVNPAVDAGVPHLMPVTMSLFGMLNWVYMWFREDGPVSRADYAALATRLFLGGLRDLG